MTTAPLPLPADDEIDLRQVAAALGRRWFWILGGGLAGLAIASIATSRMKPVWEGEFQIVLAQEDAGAVGRLAALAASNPMLANLAGLSGGSGSGGLGTEVKILESPSVLKPIFDEVLARKAAAGDNVSKLRFSDWAESNLKVELEDGTSVLNITYQDTDQAMIVPVLQQISRTYQVYSGRDRSESLENGLTYAREHVARFRTKAEASNRALDAYRIRYGIESGGRSISAGGVDLSSLTTANSGVRSQGDPLAQLAAINQELIRRRQTFTDNDPSIAALVRERDALRRYIETTGGGSLALPGQKPTSKEQAQDILLKYQQLERTAKRDTATLDSLESSLLSLQLEQARSTKPWELISTPTLSDKPVSPRPARNRALGLLAGLVLGSGCALVADRRTGRVFSSEELQALLKAPPLAHLQLSDPEASRTTLALLAQHHLHGATSLALVPVGLDAHDQRLDQLLGLLGGLKPNSRLRMASNLLEAAQSEQQLLVAAPGAATRRELANLRQQLELQEHAPLGWLLLEAGGDA